MKLGWTPEPAHTRSSLTYSFSAFPTRAPAGLKEGFLFPETSLDWTFSHLAALFRFWSLLNADPVFKASIKLSITPS